MSVCGWMNCRHATVAVLELHGSYLGLDGGYRRLGAWVAFGRAPAEHPVRELYLTPMAGPEDDAVTQLLWPVVVDASDE